MVRRSSHARSLRALAASACLPAALLTGCGSASRHHSAHTKRPATTPVELQRVSTVQSSYRMVPQSFTTAFVRRARGAIVQQSARQGLGPVSSLRCGGTVTLMIKQGSRFKGALCNAVTGGDCMQWLVGAKGRSLEAFSWRFNDMSLCKARS